jgi:hypothetical protein
MQNDTFDEDLHPTAAEARPHTEGRSRTAYDLKDAHRLLEGITDDGLQQIPVLWDGTRLEQGGVYIDLRDPQRREFKATGDMVAGPDNWYVAKHTVDYELWNALTGVEDPQRRYAPQEGEGPIREGMTPDPQYKR